MPLPQRRLQPPTRPARSSPWQHTQSPSKSAASDLSTAPADAHPSLALARTRAAQAREGALACNCCTRPEPPSARSCPQHAGGNGGSCAHCRAAFSPPSPRLHHRTASCAPVLERPGRQGKGEGAPRAHAARGVCGRGFRGQEWQVGSVGFRGIHPFERIRFREMVPNGWIFQSSVYYICAGHSEHALVRVHHLAGRGREKRAAAEATKSTNTCGGPARCIADEHRTPHACLCAPARTRAPSPLPPPSQSPIPANGSDGGAQGDGRHWRRGGSGLRRRAQEARRGAWRGPAAGRARPRPRQSS